jgi:hypothetical protein
MSFGDNHEIKTARPSELQLIGETVTISYVADPSMGHGQFRLENHGDTAVIATVESAWLELGGRRLPLDSISMFDLDKDRMASPDSFEVGAKATMKFLIGFPAISHEPPFGESSAVGLRMRVNGNELQALSPIKFVRRIPRDH